MGLGKSTVNFFLGVALSGNTGLRATVPLFLLSVLYQTQSFPEDSDVPPVGNSFLSILLQPV